jgi:hypothetical protein
VIETPLTPIRLRRTATILVAAVGLVVVSGCGGSDGDDARDVAPDAGDIVGGSDDDAARDVVRDYAEAIADGDEKKVCDTLSEDSKKRFDNGRTKCEDAYKNFGAFLNDEQKDKLRGIDPEVEVDGNSATTQIDEQPLEGKVTLKKEDGEWKVSNP